jgi:hypothetical protein
MLAPSIQDVLSSFSSSSSPSSPPIVQLPGHEGIASLQVLLTLTARYRLSVVWNYLLHGLAGGLSAPQTGRRSLPSGTPLNQGYPIDTVFLASDWLYLRFASCYTFMSLRERRGDSPHFLSSLFSASSNHSFSISTCRSSLGTSLADSPLRLTLSCIRMRVMNQRLRLSAPANRIYQITEQKIVVHVHLQLPNFV